MKIKSARYFRERYMTDERHFKPNSGYDTSFIGCSHQLPNGTFVKGFFDLYHGDKNNIDGFLRNFLKIAEDGQAIYEFLQNAVDCNSSLFYMFYNDDYFLAVNNGNVFKQSGLRSLLNIAQSTKSSSSQIGRFGIGFKLVHRLVGKGDGVTELINDYKGPIMFSWSKKSDLVDLMNHSQIESVDNIDDESNLPYLLKLVITNFPVEPNETVKDLNYQSRVLFSDNEYAELCEQVNNFLSPYIYTDDLNQGSLFFIKLGEGKRELLDKDYEQHLKVGVEYSLNTLKGLNNVRVNGTPIIKIPLELENGTIEKGTDTFNLINPEYKDDDIHFSIGYNKIDFTEANPFEKVDALKKSPTFYKYFPLSDEIHQSAIFIHCDSLSNEANRRKMHEDATNKELIPEIANFIVDKLDEYREQNDSESFCQLYANILLSDTPHDNSDWLKAVYYDIIQEYIVRSIPTINGFADIPSNVKIKRIQTDIPLSIISDDYQWFKWDGDNVDKLLKSAKAKLGISTLDIYSLIINADINKLNYWISSVDDATYESFLDEINAIHAILKDTRFVPKIRNVRLFRFTDGKFRSYNDIIKQYNGNPHFAYNRIIYTTTKTEDISDELIALGFVLSEINISNYPNIKICFDLPEDKEFFELLKSSLTETQLSKKQNRNLILHLTTQDSNKKLKGIGDESIRSLCLCHNKRGELVPLRNLIGYSYAIPTWLSDYQIKKDEYFKELDNFLMAEEDIYSDIIYDHWDNLRFNDVKDFYIDIKRLYDLDAQNNKTLKDKDYVYTEDNEFVFTKDLIYNSKMLDDNIDYKSLNNVISSIFSRQLPNKQIAALLEEEPFGLPNTNICQCLPVEDIGITLADIQNILKFSTLNNETFFKVFVIEYRDNEYHITSRTSQHFQVYVGDKATKLYLSKRMDEYSSMVLLPYNLRTYKDSEGIVSGLNLCSDILKNVEDVDAEKEELIDILKGEAQREFLNALSEIRIDLSEDTSVDSYSYKLLRMAADVIKTTEDQKSFRQKLVIVDDGKSFCYDEISQTLSDKVEIEGAKKEFDVARLLPNEYGNGYLLIEFAKKYTTLGLSNTKLNSLLGITNDTDIEELYDTIISNYKTLLTDQQLAFVLTVCSNNGQKIPSFKLIANNNEEYDGQYVVKPFSFINDCYTLSKSYWHLKDYIELPYGNNMYIDSPYIDDNGHFICTGLDTKTDEKYDFEKIIALLEFLSKLYRQNKDKFNDVDWSTLKDNLGFNTYECVYPSDFATESEALPEEVEKWIALSSKNKEVIEALGVCTEDNTIIKFRKFLNGDIHEFDNDSLYSADDVERLENSLEWIADKDVFPLTQEKYDALRTTIDRINKLRKKGKIIITDKPDIDKIEKQCEEYEGKGYSDWKEKTGYTIYLYDGNIPHIVEIDEYIEDVVFSYSKDDIADNGEDNIYVNKNADIQQAMHQLAMDNKINLKTEDVYELFNQSIIDLQKEIKRLEKEAEELRAQTPVKISIEGSKNLPKDSRPEYNEIARKKVKQRLEQEGFRFTQGIGDSSIIEGVLKPDGSPVPLVVKSCKTGKLFITPIEWEELLMPDAMLWISNGEEIAPLHLRELIMNKQRLVLEIDTSNFDDVDRVSNFAQILRYFKQVHFNFDSVHPTTTARKSKGYAFDERATDEEF